MDEDKVVTLGELLRNPRKYIDLPVRIQLYFSKSGKAYNPYFTRFNEDMYMNFSAWPLDARLYEKRDFQRAYHMFFIQRASMKLWKNLFEEDRITPIEVKAVVRDIFVGQPWIEVLDYDEKSAGLSENDVRNAVRGEALYQMGRYEEAALGYRKAIKGNHPRNIKVDLMRRLADAYYQNGKYSRAADTYKRASRLAPESTVLKQGLAASREAVKIQRARRKGQAVPAQTVHPAPRSQGVYVDMSNDVDEIIAKFEDAKVVRDAVQRDKEALTRRAEAARAGGAPVVTATPVSGQETPDAKTAEGESRTPEGCAPDDAEEAEMTEEAEVVEEAVEEAEVVEPEAVEEVEVVEEMEVVEPEPIEYGGAAYEPEETDGCAVTLDAPDPVEEEEETVAEATSEEVASEEVVEETFVEEAEPVMESTDAVEGPVVPVEADVEPSAEMPNEEPGSDVTELAPTSEPMQPVDTEGADAEGVEAYGGAVEVEVNEVTMDDTPITDDDILAAGKNIVLVAGKVMSLPRLPFFGCEAVTLTDLHSIMQDIYSNPES
jgi:tetratricopeptide (TPR) repeat protein